MLGKFSFVLRNGLIDYFYSPFNNGVITNVIRRFARPTGTSRARILSHTPRCVRRNLRSSKQTFYEYSVSVLMASCILIRAADTSGDGLNVRQINRRCAISELTVWSRDGCVCFWNCGPHDERTTVSVDNK